MTVSIPDGATAPQMLLTVREAAQRLAVSERKLFQLTKAGEIRSVTIGIRSKRYSVADLERYIAERQAIQAAS